MVLIIEKNYHAKIPNNPYFGYVKRDVGLVLPGNNHDIKVPTIEKKCKTVLGRIMYPIFKFMLVYFCYDKEFMGDEK